MIYIKRGQVIHMFQEVFYASVSFLQTNAIK